jgi:hypothetical protein
MLKSYETLIVEALEAGDEKKLSEYCSKAPKEKISFVFCNVLNSGGGVDRKKKISLILKYGGDFLNDAVKLEGESKLTTPLICAVNTWDVELVGELLQKGANAKKMFDNGNSIKSPLHEVCKCRTGLTEEQKGQRIKIIQLLLENGANVNGANNAYDSRTPLMEALCAPLNEDVVKICEILLKKEEYDLSWTDISKRTLKQIVEKRQQSEYRDAILKLISEVEARGKKKDGRRSKGVGKDGRSRVMKDGGRSRGVKRDGGRKCKKVDGRKKKDGRRSRRV